MTTAIHLIPFRPGVVAFVCVLLLATPARARAADDEPVDAPASAEPGPVESEDGGEPPSPVLIGPRPGEAVAAPVRPDQARGWEVEPGIDSADVGLLLPRAILFAPRWVIFGITWPIDQLLGVLERHAVIGHIEDILYNDARTAAIVPIVSASTFRGVSFGAKAFHDDLGGHGEKGAMSGQAGTQGDHAYELSFDADRTGGTHLWLETISRFEIDPRARFAGIGHPPDGSSGRDPRQRAVETFFEHQRLMMFGRMGYTVGQPSEMVKVGGMVRYAAHEFDAGPEDDPSIEAIYDTGQLVGFDTDYQVMELSADIVVDTRDVQGATNSGFYLEAFSGGAPPLSRDLEFFHWGLETTGYIPLYRSFRPEDGRVLVLRAAFEAVEGDDLDIPFTELPRLGGSQRLRGYAEGQFRDRKAAVATIEYHYPIHQFVAGSIYVDAGKVAYEYDDFFQEPIPRFGGGFGFLFRSRDNLLFTLDIAYGDAPQVIFTTDPLRAFAGRRTDI